MKIKLDENLPLRAAPIFADAGHDVDSVADEGLSGAADSVVAEAASAVERLVVTLDRGFGDIQRYPPGSHAGIVVRRVEDHSAPSIARTVSELVSSTDLASPLTASLDRWVQEGLRRRAMRPPGE